LDKKRILGAIFTDRLKGQSSTPEEIARWTGTGKVETTRALDELREEGLVERTERGFELTETGRRAIKVVFIGGGFEVLHKGHFYTIGKARALGDVLVVSLARDSTIRKRKNREPAATEEERKGMLSSLRQVDAVILGVEGDIYQTLEKVRPDIVALGYDQYHMEEEVEKEARNRGMELTVVRLDSPFPGTKTSSLLRET
jgi:FAD synthetase